MRIDITFATPMIYRCALRASIRKYPRRTNSLIIIFIIIIISVPHRVISIIISVQTAAILYWRCHHGIRSPAIQGVQNAPRVTKPRRALLSLPRQKTEDYWNPVAEQAANRFRGGLFSATFLANWI